MDLSPYVPRIAIAWAVDEATSTRRWREVDGSLVFADVSGFTALSERLARRGQIGAEELTDVLGRCFTELLAVAYAEGGGLLKFGGDALLLLFEGPGHAARAVRAALGMRASLRGSGGLETPVGRVRLRMSQGVHSGPLHLFRVGASHQELLICGPGASEVVRMESVAGAGEIVVSPTCAEAIRGSLPGLVAGQKGPGLLLKNRTLVHLVDGHPEPIAAPAAATGVPAGLRAHLAAGGGESEHRHVAIAFVHFDGTDQLLVRDGPDAVADALEGVVSVVQSVAEDEGVTFLATDIDHDGGKVILVAGAPAAVEDQEARLLVAARRILDTPLALPVRIGVNRGHVFAGSIGPPYRRTYTIMGDAVNLAARLMAKAKPGQIVVSPPVLELSRAAFATTPLGPFTVKGKAAPVEALLLGPAAGTRDTRAAHTLPLMGRDAEIELLEARARSGGAVVEVEGAGGMGKTRLLEELRARVGDAMPVRVVSCSAYEQATPYFAVRVLLRHSLGITGGDGLRDAVLGVAPSLEGWLPLVGDVLDVDVADTELTRGLEPQFRRRQTRLVLEELLGGLYPHHALLAFDDVQWIDDPSAEVLGDLCTQATMGERRWLVCVTRKPLGDGFRPREAEQVVLAPLDERASRALAQEAAAGAPLAPYRLDEIVRLAEGNPLFLEELVRAARRSGEEFPSTLEATVASEIDGLDPERRRLLRYAAVLGESFDGALYAEVVVRDDLAEPSAIEELLGGLVARTPDGRVAFRHRVLRDVAYRALPFRQRQELHARAAQVIERTAGEAIGERAAVLSMHCFHAHQFEKCWQHAKVGAARARAKYALVEANQLYERGLAAARRVPELPAGEVAAVWRELAETRALVGAYEASSDALRNARRLAGPDAHVQAELCAREANVAFRLGRPTSAVRWVQRGLRLLGGDTRRAARVERAGLLVFYSWVRLNTGRPRDALRLAEEAIAEADAADDASKRARAHEAAEAAIMALGRPEQGTHALVAAELFEQANEEEKTARVLNMLGASAYLAGRWDQALGLYQRSLEKFERVGNLVDAGLARCNMAEIFADQGRLAEAEARLAEASRAWRAMRLPVGVALATRHLGRIALRAGDPQRALVHFAEARAVFDQYGMQPKVAEVDTWVADCKLRLGEYDDAESLLDQVISYERSTGTAEMAPMAHRLRACLAAARGDLATSWAELDESLAMSRTRNLPFETALTLEALSAIARLGGLPEDPAHARERDEIVAGLGVGELPALPLPATP